MSVALPAASQTSDTMPKATASCVTSVPTEDEDRR